MFNNNNFWIFLICRVIKEKLKFIFYSFSLCMYPEPFQLFKWVSGDYVIKDKYCGISSKSIKPRTLSYLKPGINDFCQCQAVTMETAAAKDSCVCPLIKREKKKQHFIM